MRGQLRKRGRNLPNDMRANKRQKLTLFDLRAMIGDCHAVALRNAIVRNQTANAISRAESAQSLSALVNIANKTSLLEALGMAKPARQEKRVMPASAPAIDWTQVDPSKRFKLETKLGQGMFGVVWKATDRADGRIYALKILQQIDGETEREVAVLKRFAADSAYCHRNIICYQDMFPIKIGRKTQYAIQMEFVDGLSLDKWHDWWFANNTMPPPAYVARKFASDLFAAVAAIHEQRVYHLDIKPSNIMVRTQGQDIVLVDFGLSCAERSPRKKPETCVETDGYGTPLYMSPDYIQYCYSTKTYDKRCNESVRRYTDIWASGLTLWEVLLPGNIIMELFGEFDAQNGSEDEIPAWLRAQSAKWQHMTLYPLDRSVDNAIRFALDVKRSSTTTAADLLAMVQ